MLSDEGAENWFECFDDHAYYCVDQMLETDGNRDTELKRVDVFFEQLCGFKCISRTKWQYRELMTITAVYYKNEYQSNSNHEVANTWTLFCCIRFGFEEYSARCDKVIVTKPVVSLYFFFWRRDKHQREISFVFSFTLSGRDELQFAACKRCLAGEQVWPKSSVRCHEN